MNPTEISAKVIVLGDTSVGKSSIIQRYFEDSFDEYLPNTIGAAFQTDEIKSEDGKKLLKLNVWDTCGQERFMSIASVYYKDANVILLVVDCTNSGSLDVASRYLDEIQNHSNADPIIILVINKVDLLTDVPGELNIDSSLKKKCSFAGKIEKFIQEKEIEYDFWTSAKENGLNIKEMFRFIAKSILTEKFRVKNFGTVSQKGVIGLSYVDSRPKKKKCC